jgi:hypothetical protein
MKKIILTICITFLFCIIAHADTSVPPLINYQGMLTDADGKPMTGAKNLEFNIYDSATGGTRIWGPQIFNTVPLIGGKFNVILGTTDNGGNSITEAFGAKDRYLGIKVDTGAELVPRQQILSAPYTIKAENAAKAGHAVESDHATEADHAAKADHATEADLATAVKGLPPADHDSGWFYAEKSKNYDKEHGLGTLPRLAIVWGASDENGSDMYMMDSIHAGTVSSGVGYGSWLQRITTISYRISTGATSMSAYGVDGHWDWGDGTGFIRVFMWK